MTGGIGVGKSSLLECGLVTQLEFAQYPVVLIPNSARLVSALGTRQEDAFLKSVSNSRVRPEHDSVISVKADA